MLSLVIAAFAAGAGASAAYGQTPTPTPTTTFTGKTFSDQLARMVIEAERLLPHLMYEVEGPLMPFFIKVAELLGIAIVMTAFLKVLRQHSGASFDLAWWFGRVAFFVAMISLTTAAIDFGEDMGNAIAYGNDRKASWLNELRLGAQEAFNDSYDKFVAGTFTVRVNGEDVPVNPNPDTQNPAYAIIGVLYSRESTLEDVTNKLNLSSWSMSSLFNLLTACRGCLDFVDFLVILLRPALLIAVRLAAPFMMALALDRDFAKQSTYKYVWGVVVLTLAWPTVTQLMRFIAYTAGNMALGDPQTLYIWNNTTMTAIADPTSKPEYRVILLSGVMFAATVFVLFAHWVAYKFVMGQVFEGVANLVTQLQGGGIAVGVGTVSAAAGQAVLKQAEQTQIQGQADATAEQVKGRREAANLSAKGNEVAGIASARGSQVMALGQIEGARQAGVMQAGAAAQFGRDSTAAGVAASNRESSIQHDQTNAMTRAQQGRESIQIAGEAKAEKKDKWTGATGFGAIPVVGAPIGEGVNTAFGSSHVINHLPSGLKEVATVMTPTGESSVTTRARTQNEAANTFANNSVRIQNTATGATIGSHIQYGEDMTRAYDTKEAADKAAVNLQAQVAAGGVNAGTGIIMGGVENKYGYDMRANRVEFESGMKAMQISRDAGIESSILKSQGALISQVGSILANQTNQMFREVRF
jgi:hypothetical protein